MERPTWRAHQERLKQSTRTEARHKTRRRRLFLLLILAGSVFFLIRCLPGALDNLFSGDPAPERQTTEKADPPAQVEASVDASKNESVQKAATDDKETKEPPKIVVLNRDGLQPPPDEDLDKKHLAEIIGARPLQPDEIHSFAIKDEEGHYLYVRTTMDPELQGWAAKLLKTTKSRSAALVVLNPANGDVISMASYNAAGESVNMALKSNFPAASLFKIVTAAAAVENKKLNSGSKLAYDGRKHTLYKKDVNKGIKEGSHAVTLKEGFAQSINTVFGKVGAFTLGPKELEGFAQKFHFNQPITFEMQVQESHFEAPEKEDPYRLAELASGFNRTTKVSPLHGAMLASAIINNGKLMEPTLVREVFDQDNRIFYRNEPVSLGQVVSLKTVQELRTMMRATLHEGTGRKRFRDISSHKVLKQLEIGGKSGTINNDQGHKVDWFVSYAKEKKGKKSIALAAVVIHNPKLGTRSQEIVREAILHYFQPRL